ncbi:hypothetical protein ABFS83_11G075600 [Erythranthe nasuta]
MKMEFARIKTPIYFLGLFYLKKINCISLPPKHYLYCLCQKIVISPRLHTHIPSSFTIKSCLISLIYTDLERKLFFFWQFFTCLRRLVSHIRLRIGALLSWKSKAAR